MSTWKMAWRNIWRNRRRTMVTVAAMSIAVFVTIIYSGLVAGMVTQMQSDALDLELGAAQIFAPGYQDRPSIYTSIAGTDGILERLDAAGVPAAPRLLGAGLAAHGAASAGAFFRGLDLGRDPKVLTLSKQVMEGEWLDGADPKGVVLGRRLARTLGVEPGSEVVVLSQATDGSIANDLFTVRGVLKSVGEMTDRGGIFMSQAMFRELMVFDGGAHQIIIGRPAVLDTALLKATVVGAAPDQHVQSWRELSPTLASMLDSVMGLINIMFFIVNVAIAIVLLNAMLMSVFERIREFGVLKALGISPGGVMRLIYVESVMQVCVAVGVGVLFTIPALLYLSSVGIDMAALSGTSIMGMSMMSTWYAEVSPRTFGQPIFMTVLVVSMAVLYPAYKAAVIQPVEAMRHQ